MPSSNRVRIGCCHHREELAGRDRTWAGGGNRAGEEGMGANAFRRFEGRCGASETRQRGLYGCGVVEASLAAQRRLVRAWLEMMR